MGFIDSISDLTSVTSRVNTSFFPSFSFGGSIGRVDSMGSDIFNDVVAAIDPTSTIPAVTNSTGGGKYQPPKGPAPAAEISYNAHGPAISSDLNAEVPMWKNPLVIGGAIVIAYIVLKRI